MKFLIRLGFSLAILVIAFQHVDFLSVTRQFNRLDPLSLGLALLLITLGMVLAAARWRMVTLNTEGNAPGLMFFVRSFYRGAFLNQGLPTILGGDALRVFDLARALGNNRDAFGTVLLDRVIGFSGLLIINVLMFPLSFMLFPTPLALAVAGISVSGLIAIAIVLSLPWERFSRRHKILDLIAELNAFGRRVLAHPRGFLLQHALSVLVHGCSILAMFVLARQFGIDADFWTHLAIQPSVIIVTLLPLSLAGWGMREGAMAGLFATIGVAAPAVMATSLTYGAIALLSTLPGLFFLIKQPGNNDTAAREETNKQI